MKQNGHKPLRKRRERNYSDKEKAAALVVLDFCEGNESEAARRTGIPTNTLRDWNLGRNRNEHVTELREEKKADLADSLEKLAFDLIDKVKTSEKAGGVDLGIVIDKMLLLRGEPNSISRDATHAAPEQRRARILQLVEKAKVA